ITERKKAAEAERLNVRRRDQFLAMLSHELRNPLGAIINAMQVMELSPDAETSAEVARVISRQAQHMSRLLDDLLDVSRVTQNKIQMRREVLDLRTTTE